MPPASSWLEEAALRAPIDDAATAGHLDVVVGGQSRRFVLPITLTPFASVVPCSAKCVFCSETLIPVDTTELSASLRPQADYFDAFRAALSQLRPLPMGISLSGLEATDNVPWLVSVLDCLTAHEASGGRLLEKVLYSNGAGLASPEHGQPLIDRLAQFRLDRVELSRHHEEAEANQRIMRFRDGVQVRQQQTFEQVIAAVRGRLHVRLVCVVQREGVDSLERVRRYLDWAHDHGITDVVFRELSRLGDSYRPNPTFVRIQATRVRIDDLLQAVWSATQGTSPDFLLTGGKRGYYYWNLRFRYRDAMDVTFETSDYDVMKRRHHSSAIYKLVFHASGALCGDWDPTKDILIPGNASGGGSA